MCIRDSLEAASVGGDRGSNGRGVRVSGFRGVERVREMRGRERGPGMRE